MTHARVARSAALTPTRVFASLLLGGALVFTAGQAVQAASPSPAKSASAPVGCQDGACPMHRGEHGGKAGHHGHHREGHGMKGAAGAGLPFAGPGFERLLDEVKATDAQRKQIRDISDKARTDLRALHEKGKAQHGEAMAIWTSPKLDAGEAEKHRQQMLAQHDQVSKRMMQAMLDVGQVLTPEQRAKAATLLKQRQERMQERMERRDGTQGVAPPDEMLRDHKMRRLAPPASAPAGASQPAPSR